jgi:hypothetical protein
VAVTTTNLVQGPATVYYGDYGAVEPEDSSVGSAPAGSAWTDLGGTSDGVTITIEQEYSELTVDQLVDRVESRITGRTMKVATNLAEATLTNLSYAINGGTSASGSGWASLDPDTSASATQPTYFALIVDGYAPGTDKRRRFILRRGLNVSGSVEMAYKKDGQTLIPIEVTAHYVSSSVTPFHIVDET